ncbi:hypothetical protein CC79DRAFT_819090 [Sarocladium strictum]
MPTELTPDQLATELQADLKPTETMTPDERTIDEWGMQMMQEDSTVRPRDAIHAGAVAEGENFHMHNGDVYKHDGDKKSIITNVYNVYNCHGCTFCSCRSVKSRSKSKSARRSSRKLALSQGGSKQKQADKERGRSFFWTSDYWYWLPRLVATWWFDRRLSWVASAETHGSSLEHSEAALH